MAVKIPEVQRGNVPDDSVSQQITARAPNFAKNNAAVQDALGLALQRGSKIEADAHMSKAQTMKNERQSNKHKHWNGANAKGQEKEPIQAYTGRMKHLGTRDVGGDGVGPREPIVGPPQPVDRPPDRKQRRVGLRYIQGSPDEEYNSFHKIFKKRHEDDIKAAENLHGRAKQLYLAGIKKTFDEIMAKSISQQHAQNDKYEQNVANGKIALVKRAAVENTAMVIDGVDSSLEQFEGSIEELKLTTMEYAVKYGGAEETPDGKFVVKGDDGEIRKFNLTPQVQNQVVGDVSDTYFNAINNMASAGETEKAKFMFNKYEKMIDPKVDRPRLLAKLKSNDEKSKAFEVIGKLRGKSESQQQTIIDGIKDEEVRQKVLGLREQRDGYHRNRKKQLSNKHYQPLSIKLAKNQAGPNKFTNVRQLEAWNEFERVEGFITEPRERKALYEQVTNPKTSNTTTLYGLYDEWVTGPGFTGMSMSDLGVKMVGLNNRHKNSIISLWRIDNGETPGQQQSRLKSLYKKMEKLANFPKLRNGKYAEKYQTRLTQLWGEIDDNEDRFPLKGGTEENKILNEIYVGDKLGMKQKADDSAFTRLWDKYNPFNTKGSNDRIKARSKKGESGVTSTPTPKVTKTVRPDGTKAYGKLSPAEKDQVWDEWEKANPKVKAKPTYKQLEKFYNDKLKKKGE
jgi:hypothetical protein